MRNRACSMFLSQHLICVMVSKYVLIFIVVWFISSFDFDITVSHFSNSYDVGSQILHVTYFDVEVLMESVWHIYWQNVIWYIYLIYDLI